MTDQPEPVLTFTEDQFQQIANQVSGMIHQVMHQFHAANAARFGEGSEQLGDAGPVVAGVVGGLLQFMMEGEPDNAKVRADILTQMDDLIPQFRIEMMAEAAGSVGSGSA